MKLRIKPGNIPVLALCAGVLGLGLRLLQFQVGVDEKGLLITWHPLSVIVLLLTGLVFGWMLYSVWPMSQAVRYVQIFPRSLPAALGTVVGAVGVVCYSVELVLPMTDLYFLAEMAFSLLAAGCMVFLAFQRAKGRHANIWAWMGVSLFFLLHLVGCCRLWFNATQLDSYLYPVLSSSFLTLAVYYRAAMCDQSVGVRGYLFFGSAAAYCCLLSLVGSENPIFYGAMLIWMATDRCRFQPRKIPA